MSFDQMVKELTVFFYQFIEPFLNNEDDISAIHLVIQQLAKIEPGRTKVKQVRLPNRKP